MESGGDYNLLRNSLFLIHMGSVIKKALPIAATVAGAYFGGPVGAAAANAAVTKVQGGSWGDALKSGAFTYGGSQLGSALGGSSIGRSLGISGTVGDALGSTAQNAVGPSFMNLGLGSILGNSTSNAIGASLANTSLGSALGGYAGNSLANPGKSTPQNSQPAGFVPKQQTQQDLPSSLSAFGSLSPEQQSSNIATQGVYGGGAGPDEQSYFMNLINRRLVDQAGNVDQNMSDINPIENSYLSQLGLGGYGDSKSLLEAMSKWKSA